MNSPREILAAFEILIVDDDRIFGLLHKHQLRLLKTRKTPVILFNGKEAIEYIESTLKRVINFLIVLDLNMPVMDGWEFLRLVQTKKYANRIWVVVVSSSVYKHDKEMALAHNQVLGYYEKPLNIETVQEIVLLEKIRTNFRLNFKSEGYTK